MQERVVLWTWLWLLDEVHPNSEAGGVDKFYLKENVGFFFKKGKKVWL